MPIFIRTLLLGVAMVGALGCAAPGHAQSRDTLQKIKESGVIQLGGRDASFPFSYKIAADAAPIGFSADLCAKIVEAVKTKLGMPQLKVNYTIVTPSNRIALVQNDTIDLECSTTTNTTARAQQVEFAPTHFVGSITALVRKNSGIENIAQLDGKRIATVTGSTSIQLLRKYRRSESVQFQEISGKDTSETFLLLSTGRADAMVLEDVQLVGLAAMSGQASDFKLVAERLRDEPYGFMFRKDDPTFKALVDDTMTRLMKTGEIQEIYAKWFTRPVPPNQVNLNFPMSPSVQEAYRNPNNRGI